MKLVSFKRSISQTQERIILPYGEHKTSSDIEGKEATRLHSNTMKYNIGKISLTVWSLFQCQCYRYNTNVPVQGRNSNGMPRTKPGSGNKREVWSNKQDDSHMLQDESCSSYGQRFSLRSLFFKTGGLLSLPTYHSSNGQVTDLRKALKFVVGEKNKIK